MKKRILYSLAGVCTLLFTLTACENLDELSNLGLRPHILAPALKTEIDIYDFERLLTQTTEYEVAINQLPLGNTPFPFFPKTTIPGKLPSEYLNIFEIANKIALDTLRATLSFDNIFPVPIEPNTRIVLRDSANPSKVLLNHVINRSVPSGDNYEFQLIRSSDIITSTLELYMEDLTLGSGTNVTFNDDDIFVLKVSVDLIDLNYVELKNDVSYSDVAIHPFNINIPDAADTSAYSGSLSIFLTNKYPAGFLLQMDLLDENENTVFKVFGDSSLFVENAPVDPNTGVVIGETIADKLKFIKVEDISNLNNVKKMRVGVTLKTPSSPNKLILSEITTIDMLITADIQVDPSKSNK